MRKILSDIVGRDKEIQELRIILESTSVVMSSTRRMGKTMILTKIDESNYPDTKTILCFIESVQSAEEFVNGLREHLITQKLLHEKDFIKVSNWLIDNFGEKDFGFFKTPNFKTHWKIILNLMMDDLVEKHKDQVVLMLDEFPKMLWNLMQNGNHLEAEEILDELRSIREKHEKRSKLRFIYCGSVGMNLVINELVKKYKYAGAPLNNMHHYIVHEMSEEDSVMLVTYLVKKKNLLLEADMFTYLAQACSYLPFFIDRIITQINLLSIKKTITKKDIDSVVDNFIAGRENNNQFNHFTERIDTYYDIQEKRIAHEILRIIAKSNETFSSDTIINNVKYKIQCDDFEISKILSDLYEDMYLDRTIDNDTVNYNFRYALLKKWWKLNYA